MCLDYVTEAPRYVVCLCLSSGWFTHSEPHRTFSPHMITEIARQEGGQERGREGGRERERGRAYGSLSSFLQI